MITMKAQQKALHTFAELAIPHSNGECPCFIRVVLGEDALACAAGRSLSIPANLASGVAGGSLSVGFDRRDGAGRYVSTQTLAAGWMVLVPRHIGSGNRVSAGGRSGKGGSLRLHPLIGIFVMIAWSLDDWAEARKVPTVWRVVPVMCVLIALGAVTLRQMGQWESEYALWTNTVQVTDKNPGAHGRLAAALQHPAVTMSKRDLESSTLHKSAWMRHVNITRKP